MDLSPQIVEARQLLASISIFEMPPQLVRTFAIVDGMLHGVVPTFSWGKAIKLIDQLHGEGCPKKAILKEAQQKIIQAQVVSSLAPAPAPVAVSVSTLEAKGSPSPSWGPSPLSKALGLSSDWKAPLPPTTDKLKGMEFGPGEMQAKALASAVFGSAVPPIEPPIVSQVAPSVPETLFKTTKVEVTLEGGMVAVKTPFSASFVAALKTLPLQDRKWHAVKKTWYIAPIHQEWAINLVKEHFVGGSQTFVF